MSESSEDELMHYGILRKSGRYPWGSGGERDAAGDKGIYARSRSFQQMVAELRDKGIPDKDIAKAMGLDPETEKAFTLTTLRDTRTLAKEEINRIETNKAVTLRDKGMSPKAIAERMGKPESTVRLLIKNSERVQKESLQATAKVIRDAVDTHDIVDIGLGNNYLMKISPERFRTAVGILKAEKYETYTLPVKQPGSRNSTNQKVLVKPGTGYGNARRMTDRIHTMVTWTENEGRTYSHILPPISINSNRLAIVYAEHGGGNQDGVVYVRPGVSDLGMGKNKYAQVRIMIDKTHFIKGMAILTDNIPAGKDLLFHTSKSETVGLKGALKPNKEDAANPFSSTIKRQIIEKDAKGNDVVKSAINILNETGDWETWSNSLSSQMLSKQPQTFIKAQLAVTAKQQKAKIDEINSITNPTLRRKQLEKMSDQIDADAVDLRAAAMPHQRTQVIMPVLKMSPHEVYAPRFETGEKVVLIRYPHAGKFEIPELTVNNKNRAAIKLLGNATDAIGIHPKVAQKLSGADFDGDTVVVIPNPKSVIRGANTLGRANYDYAKGLDGFNPQTKYGGFVQKTDAKGNLVTDSKGDPIGNFKLMKNTGMEMGKITNLITDMQIQGAHPDHVVRAVRHSMVVIDAENKNLDFRRSEQENGIAALKKTYQGAEKSGASSLLSKATATIRIPERKLRLVKDGGPIDPKTGAKVFVDTGRAINKYDKKTNTYDPNTKVPVLETVKKLSITTDAHTLVSKRRDPIELIYADHANVMKGVANQTRLLASKVVTPKQNTDPAAKKEYAAELAHVKEQLHKAIAQKPLDRHANVIANAIIKQKLQEDPTLRFDRDRRLKVERQTKQGVREKMQLKAHEIQLSDRAWDAIQAGVISANMFKKILDGNYVKDERLFELAIPRKNAVLTTNVMSRAKAMMNAGMTNADIARVLGVPASTIRSAVVRGDL